MTRVTRFDLPLLRKELIERAASPRHYFERIGFAIGMFGIFLISVGNMSADATALSLGAGREFFWVLYGVACAAVFLGLPASLATSVPDERERGSLDLLRVTDLSGLEIVLQKYFGRLLPFAVVMSIACPAVAGLYAFGGLTVRTLGVAALSLGLLGLQVGALTIACGAGSASPGRALFRAYAAVAVFYGLIPLVAMLLDVHWHDSYVHVPILLFVDAASGDPGSPLLWRSVLALATVALFLGAARFFLWRGPAVKQATMATLQVRERKHRAIEKRDGVADENPVRWRALRQAKWLSKRRATTVGLAVMLVYFVFGEHVSPFGFDLPAEVITLNVWAAGVLVAALYGLNAIAAERANQTLDVLLTTPIAPREIIRQKAAPLYRAIVWVAVIYGTICLTESQHWAIRGTLVVAQEPEWPRPWSVLVNGAGAVASVVAYLFPAAWLGIWLGLRARKRARAAVIAITVIAIATIGPLLGVFVSRTVLGWWLPISLVAGWWIWQVGRTPVTVRQRVVIWIGLAVSALLALGSADVRGFFPWIFGTSPLLVAGSWFRLPPSLEEIMKIGASMSLYFTWGLGLRFASLAAASDALAGRKITGWSGNRRKGAALS